MASEGELGMFSTMYGFCIVTPHCFVLLLWFVFFNMDFSHTFEMLNTTESSPRR